MIHIRPRFPVNAMFARVGAAVAGAPAGVKATLGDVWRDLSVSVCEKSGGGHYDAHHPTSHVHAPCPHERAW
ncbi:hypothetical protein GCM10010218_46890 [Streptomyces mashuensis]|uniref:Uncharacterized protein n=1 Tax=Streptomyces mashuensis TaxID=33904 RepID=A0A919B6M6_9ACTN|nr:hypothetical protein GCM10010218_46890 [Streptomyces mashuensis]